MNYKKVNLIFVMVFLLVFSIPIIMSAETQASADENSKMPDLDGFNKKTSSDGTATYTPKQNNAVFEYKSPEGIPQKIEGIAGGTITLESSGKGQRVKDIQVSIGTLNSQYNAMLNGMNTPVAAGSTITGGGDKFNVNTISGSSINGEPKPAPGIKDLKTEVGYSVNGKDRESITITADNGDKYSVGTMKYNRGGEEKNTGQLIFDKNGKYFKDSLYLNNKLVINTENTNVRVFTNGLRQENSNSPYVSMRDNGIKTNEAIVSGGSKDFSGPAVLINSPDKGSQEYFIIQGGKGSDFTYTKAPGQIPSLDVYGKHIFSMRDAALQISSDGKNIFKSYDSSSVYQYNDNFKDFKLSIRGENDKLLYQYGVVKDADKIPITGEFRNGQIDNPFGSGKLTTSSAMNSFNGIKKNLNFISDFRAASELENSPVTQESIRTRYGELMKADTLFQIPEGPGIKPNSGNNIFYNLVDGVFGNNGNSKEQINLESLRNTLYIPSGLKDAPFEVRDRSPAYLQLPLYHLLPTKLQNDISPGSTASQEQIQQEFYQFIRDNSKGDPKLFVQAYPEFVKRYQNYIPPEARFFLSVR